MSYPLLRLSRDYARVDVRLGRGAQRWEDMIEIFSGPAAEGVEWSGGEGDKLSAKHCSWPTQPGSSLSLPYTVSSTEGLGSGQAEVLEFP